MKDTTRERVTITVERTIEYSEGCRQNAIEDAERLAKGGETTTVGSGEYWSVEDEIDLS